MTKPINDKSDFFQQYWALATQYGIALISVITSIVYAPQFLTFQQKDFRTLSQFLAASILLILIIPINKWDKPRHQNGWWVVCILCFLSAVSLIYKYQQDIVLKSLPYSDSRVIIGDLSQMTPTALIQKKKIEQHWNKPFTLEECVRLNGGNTKEFWEEDILFHNYQQLLVEYFLIIITIALFSLSVIQSIRCRNKIPVVISEK